MRPQTLSEYIGQEHILGYDKPLRRAIEHGNCPSMILWGPPGIGKTTLAELIAKKSNARVERISAVVSGIKEIREAIDKAKHNLSFGYKTILFVDEVHRFNKSQQDAFLPYIENGTIIFIGATTENPSFELNNAILSRTRVYILKKLSIADIEKIIMRAVLSPVGLAERNLVFAPNVLTRLAELSDGDARRSLNFLEILADLAEPIGDNKNEISMEALASVVGSRAKLFDKNGDRYYDFISAFHKSVRGSSPQGALYWMARIISAGGDPLYVARRLLAIASEDIGNADPKAMQVVIAAWDCYERVGKAEGERAIAQAAVYCATAPKSNSVYIAWNSVLEDVKNLPDYDVPLYLRNAPTKLMENLGYHKGYRYAHDEPGAYAAGECFLPPEIRNKEWYKPSDRGFEKWVQEKIAYLKDRDMRSTNKRYPNDNDYTSS
ncbi:MAG: replication-associated recombination protein A [Succinivibrionaceae bacterium]